MSEVTYHSLVLRRRDQGESDRRLTLLTREAGVVDVVAKGARKAGSRLAGISEPLAVAVLQVATGKRQAFVTQSQPITTFPGLRSDFDRLGFALALTEGAAAVLPHGQSADGEFEFLLRALSYLQVHERPLVATVWASLRLLVLAGFQPSFDRCALTDEPVRETPSWVSPMAGGFVCADRAGEFPDRFAVRAEALFGLAACLPLEQPPTQLRFAEDCYRALYPLWRSGAEKPLPAYEACLQNLDP